MAKVQTKARHKPAPAAKPGILPVQAIRGLIEAGACARGRAARCPTSFSPRASTCGLAPRRFGCAPAFSRALKRGSLPSWQTCSCTPSTSPRAPCWRPAASISCRCSRAWRCRTTLAAASNPKSSTGRLDVFTRVIADGVAAFDQVPGGYEGPLYAEICPQTFPIVVRQGSRLSQIRFRVGASEDSDLALIELQQPREARLRRAARHRARHRPVGRPRRATRAGSSAIAPSGTPVSSMSMRRALAASSISGSRSAATMQSA